MEIPHYQAYQHTQKITKTRHNTLHNKQHKQQNKKTQTHTTTIKQPHLTTTNNHNKEPREIHSQKTRNKITSHAKKQGTR